ncbi:MAG TPA: ABC transporter permease [Chthoniobacterales bacterium]|nr:ABC transporter permease [Chthoniobacterales bacterium]
MKKLVTKSEFYLFLLIVALGATFTIANPRFLAFQNILDLLKSYSFFGILSVGALVVLLSGGIDISFTAVAQVAEYVTVAVILQYGGNLFTAFLISCAIGIVLGLVNGLLIHFLRIPPIITTIATLNLYFGTLYVISTGNIIYQVPRFFQDLSSATLPGGIPIVAMLWLGVVILTGLILRYTLLGRSIYALGGNPMAAERVGFKVLHTRLFVYAFMGLLAGFGAVVHAALVQSAIPNSIVGHELDVLAAVVLGGANIFGGSGSLIGTFMGVGLLAMLGNGLTLMGISSYWNDVVVGVVLLVGVTFSSLQRMHLAGRRAKVLVEEGGV